MPQPSVLMACYSMTGHKKAAAEDVAARLGADIEPILLPQPPPRGAFRLRFAIQWGHWPGKACTFGAFNSV